MPQKKFPMQMAFLFFLEINVNILDIFCPIKVLWNYCLFRYRIKLF